MLPRHLAKEDQVESSEKSMVVECVLNYFTMHCTAEETCRCMWRRNGGRECYITHIATDAAAASHLQSKSRVTSTRLGREASSKVSLISFPTRTWHPTQAHSSVCVEGGTRLPMCKPNLLKTEQTQRAPTHPNVAFEKTQMISRSGSLDISACSLLPE